MKNVSFMAFSLLMFGLLCAGGTRAHGPEFQTFLAATADDVINEMIIARKTG